MIVTGFNCYRYYLAAKTHFSKLDFDVFKLKGSKCSLESFDQRKDKLQFELLASKFDDPQELVVYIVANLAVGFNGFMYDRETAVLNYNRWVEYKLSPLYKFQTDLSVIESHLDKCGGPFHAAVWTCYLRKTINIQSVHIIDELNSVFANFSESLLLLHKDDILRIRKCKGFIRISENMKQSFYQQFIPETL